MRKSLSSLLTGLFTLSGFVLPLASPSRAANSFWSPGANPGHIDSPSITGQEKFIIANDVDGYCDGVFKHSVGNVYFTPNSDGQGRLSFGFSLSPGSKLILGDVVSGFMLQSIVQYYKINPPYGPHLNKPSNYDFHGSILTYNRLGSKSSFRIQSGNKIKFVWLVTGTGARSRAAVVRAVECTVR